MRKLALIIVLIAFVFGSFGAGASAAVFSDLSPGHRFYHEMMYLEGEGIITGYPDGTFRPDGEVTRAAAAIMIGRALGLNGEQRNTPFTDVDARQIASGYIASAAAEGIIQGYPDNTFRPNETVTRGQMAIFLSRAFELEAEAEAPFSDISPSMASYVHIKRILAENLTQGYPDNTFRPNMKVTRAQYSAFLARALNAEFKVDIPPATFSYLKDPSKTYYYTSEYLGDFSMRFSNVYERVWNQWTVDVVAGHPYSILEREDGSGYYLGYPESEYQMELKFPVKAGQSWSAGLDYEFYYEITAVGLNVKTPAGTFRQVAEVTRDDGYTSYFAPGVGRILENYEGVTQLELIKIE